MSILITGRAADIGSHMVHELADAGEGVVVRDNLSTGCVIRRKGATDSDAKWPPIPTEVGHRFRSKPATQLRPV